MSVLLDLSIFPVDMGTSLSPFIAPVVEMIAASGHDYQLTAMGTLIETDSLAQALTLIERAHAILAELGCERVYATAKFDIRAHASQRLGGKVASVTQRLGQGSQQQTRQPDTGDSTSGTTSP
ncbi:hypothetical protein Thiowin_02259 [Thiorhodovibrio winogradskyi]|uniref:Thiamine-binding protein domain-containing protein n=1 Tax=Thiorhodovibrio winogradskyi TaxID=77007 RepID=A0ABZ0SAB9_9GAMM|nr:MTH1187 family thiamine-binding protein [Thiorhodovibrio winogradskyi]